MEECLVHVEGVVNEGCEGSAAWEKVLSKFEAPLVWKERW